MTTAVLSKQEVVYPESDGQPIADNTKQFRWIVTIKSGLDILFADRPDVFVAGDLLWYPVEGNNKIRTAPDALVAFGRPKGDRGSYQQWREDGIPPQIVFEVLSPGNRFREMYDKLRFYERYGVEEYYIYDPDRVSFEGWLRAGQELVPIDALEGWVSPRLGIRFELEDDEIQIYYPDGRKFSSIIELDQQVKQAQQAAAQAQQAAAQAQQERAEAQQAAVQAQQERAEAQERAERLAAQLRALGVDPNQ